MLDTLRELLRPFRSTPTAPPRTKFSEETTLLCLARTPYAASTSRTRQLLRAFAEAGASVLYLEPASSATVPAPQTLSPFAPERRQPNIRVVPPATDIRARLTGRLLLLTDDPARHDALDLIRPHLVLFDSAGEIESPAFHAMSAQADLIFVADRSLLAYHGGRAHLLDPAVPQTVEDALYWMHQTPNRPAPLM